jgi:hypothetical protein
LPAVSYQLRISARSTYLHAVVTGENSSQNVASYMAEVMRECAARGCPRVLIEEHLVGPRLNTIEVFGLVSKGSTQFLRKLEAMAYVDVNAEGDVMAFAEDVAVNRGFPVRVFRSVADAERWLEDYGSDS